MVNWITLDSTGGTSGITQIELTVLVNSEYSARTTNLTVRTSSHNLTDTVIINQAAKGSTGEMNFNPSALSYNYEGGILYLNFTANTDWNVVSWPDWVGVTGDGFSGSSGSYTWAVTALVNDTGEDLDSNFNFYCGGNYFNVPVHQAKYENLYLTAIPSSIESIPNVGSIYTITVSANTDWQIVESPDWVNFDITSGTGIMNISTTVLPNESSARTGNIIIQGKTHSGLTSTILLAQNEQIPTELDYLTFEILSGGTIKWEGEEIEYSMDNGLSWTTISNERINVSAGDVVKFKGDNDEYLYSSFNGTGCKFKVYGNIMSLIDSTGYTTATTLPSTYTFEGLFNGCTGLTDASDLILPATAMTEGCYEGMFSACISLTGAPTLPATVLATDCYGGMFSNCSSLTTAPALPATTLATSCYSNMFGLCDSLVVAPALPATTLADGCYYCMFLECVSLTGAPTLPATTLAEGCYDSMFKGCTNLTTAPELNASTLVDGCYMWMFSGCSRLNYIKCPATDISAEDCTYGWVSNVASAGTFVKADSMEDWTTGVNGIPVGWVVEEVIVYDKDYLTFEIISSGNVAWHSDSTGFTKTIQYSKNGGVWTNITSYINAKIISVEAGDVIKFRADNDTYTSGTTNNNSFIGTSCQFKLSGNIMSIINKNDFTVPMQSAATFTSFFEGCYGLIDASDLILPATALTEYCYSSMFKDCTSLVNAPALPATVLAVNCYSDMFKGCSNLTTIPALPATTLTYACYKGMFYDCINLDAVPTLPATALTGYCYAEMFYECRSLTTAPVLPATILADNCYADMFKNCTSLTTAPELPATTLAGGCYYRMFEYCTGLTTAPVLPATSIGGYEYYHMFFKCSNLNYVKCLATSKTGYYSTNEWLTGVSATGTFERPSGTSINWSRDGSGIPSGWTIRNI